MRRLPALICAIFSLPLVAAPAATHPASRPAPTTMVKLANGSVRIFLPEGWTVASVAEDGQTGRYTLPDGKSWMAVNISQQDTTLSNRAAQQIKMSLIAALKKQFTESHTEVVMQPTYERDERFFMRVHDRIKVEGQVLDELHIYRMMGIDLLCITLVIYGDTPQSARPLQKAGEDVALDIQVGNADKKPPKK